VEKGEMQMAIGLMEHSSRGSTRAGLFNMKEKKKKKKSRCSDVFVYVQTSTERAMEGRHFY
jgi:hypothetical protein